MTKRTIDLKIATTRMNSRKLIKLITKADLVYDERYKIFQLVIKVSGLRRPFIIPIKYKHDRPN